MNIGFSFVSLANTQQKQLPKQEAAGSIAMAPVSSVETAGSVASSSTSSGSSFSCVA